MPYAVVFCAAAANCNLGHGGNQTTTTNSAGKVGKPLCKEKGRVTACCCTFAHQIKCICCGSFVKQKPEKVEQPRQTANKPSRKQTNSEVAVLVLGKCRELGHAVAESWGPEAQHNETKCRAKE